MAPASRRPAAIEVLVETLTGAGFRLRVSSFETVLSVKARIQRIEGVPVSQQHLIYNNKELLDGSSLLESGVHSGSRIQLVVAMRGGPVNMKRLPMYDDITRAELHQLMDMQSESPWESDSVGRQVTTDSDSSLSGSESPWESDSSGRQVTTDSDSESPWESDSSGRQVTTDSDSSLRSESPWESDSSGRQVTTDSDSSLSGSESVPGSLTRRAVSESPWESDSSGRQVTTDSDSSLRSESPWESDSSGRQ
ncbi:AN1-type zinc finger protein 4 [Amphibalanus amphitrite]|uniref:AN1-type zinc finger protein 4 n=1 Tax=Amphibalanus amphitrite TaxID=1232801 RepID=A0A6A4WH52_AMPAM|nr:AN1-type zinc finger protein 4 [Amphibalanus amphitrite]